MIVRAFKRARLMLGAYQVAEIEPYADPSGQYTEGGDAPQAITLKMTSAMDEPFVNRTVTLILTERAQRDLIATLEANLHPTWEDKLESLRSVTHESASKVEW